MFEAIVAREVTKQFGTYLPQPQSPSWKRMPRLGLADIHSSETQADQVRSNASQNVVAVDRVSFRVGQGEIFGLVGPTGSGKSTLIRLLAALIAPDRGELLVFGYDVAGQPLQVKRLVNRVSVESSLFRQLSPVENLTYSARLYGKSGTELRRRVTEILTRLGLEQPSLSKPMEALPRAVYQMVTIANALLSRPRLLLLDEPTTGLDAHARLEVQQILQELRCEHGTTILLATRDLAQASLSCDRIAVLDKGKLMAIEAGVQPEGEAQPDCQPLTWAEIFPAWAGSKLVNDLEMS